MADIDIPSGPDFGPPKTTSQPTKVTTDASSTAVCGRCNKPIQGQGLQALGKKWHAECFSCDFCTKPFMEAAFVQKYERPFCKPCDTRLFSMYCKSCNNPIEGQAINAMNTTWHPDHFLCSKCKTSLGNGVFHEKNGKPFCLTCIAAVP